MHSGYHQNDRLQEYTRWEVEVDELEGVFEVGVVEVEKFLKPLLKQFFLLGCKQWESALLSEL